MIRKLFVDRLLPAFIILFLIMLAWWAIAGGVHQFSHSNTIGQIMETIVQLLCGILSLLTVFTNFRLRKWARPIRLAWAISLVITAALSSLVWGPPMPFIALGFAAVALLVSMGVLWTLNRLSKSTVNTVD
ncbi:hypothetical protein [Rhodohalobacter sp.]|uniref:hypothetical protein n=1 Tax=Rhodohalobacter sp. TaxID=1974210 RepID=UPI002ACEC54E|nr:hypothetical protein [Rhodohalobacter sp.]MDZ7758068.1 hypothetical protein [Rhodohalobacter sp.]